MAALFNNSPPRVAAAARGCSNSDVDGRMLCWPTSQGPVVDSADAKPDEAVVEAAETADAELRWLLSVECNLGVCRNNMNTFGCMRCHIDYHRSLFYGPFIQSQRGLWVMVLLFQDDNVCRMC